MTSRWAADPWQRAELRWFDGMNWTQHVSNGGVLGADFPVGPPTAPGAPAPSAPPAPPAPAPAAAAVPAGAAHFTTVAPSSLSPSERRALHRLPMWLKVLVAVLLLAMIGGWLSYTDGHVLAPVLGWRKYTLSGHSMDPTFHSGDQVWCEPLSRSDVARLQPGAVVALRVRTPNSVTLVKRVAGLGGDTLEARGGALYRNGTEEPGLKKLTAENQLDDFAEIRIPPGSVFVLGDNFMNSRDSRDIGPIRDEDVLCRVQP